MSSSSSGNNSGVMVQGSGGGAWRRGLYSSPSSSGPYHLSGSNMQHGHGANVSATTVPFQSDFLHAGIFYLYASHFNFVSSFIIL
jgi:hypothetical protein